jgi:hypothetical protein
MNLRRITGTMLMAAALSLGAVLGSFAPAVQALADNNAGTATVSSDPHPDTASGCNQRVCIRVVGRGLSVDYVSSSAFPTGRVCTYATLSVNNRAYAGTNWVCINGPRQYGLAYFGLHRNFANGDVFCVTWYKIPGRPCETVLK